MNYSYSAYLFDFDYTLGDATEGIVESVNYALEKMDFPKAAKPDIMKTVGMHLAETYRYLTKDADMNGAGRFIDLFKQRADEIMLENTRLFNETEPLLRLLKAKSIKTAIVTSKYHYRMTQILNKYDIPYLIDAVVGGEDVKNPKPHPEPLLNAIKLLGVTKNECVYIGDSFIDAETAQRASVDFIGVTTGTTAKEELGAFPNIRIVNCLAELISFISA